VLLLAACARAPAPSTCCSTYDDVKAFDGRRVSLLGVYTPIAVRKGLKNKAEDDRARTVAIVASEALSVMLEVYYAPLGTRSEDEIARFAGKRVRVVGTLHARTPEQSLPEGVAQTMIGPCLTEIESIQPVP
jgi:hypothetical protein